MLSGFWYEPLQIMHNCSHTILQKLWLLFNIVLNILNKNCDIVIAFLLFLFYFF